MDSSEPMAQEASPSIADVEEKLRLQNVVRNGANWFLWVAGLSLLNSVMSLSGSRFQFIFGLGISQVVDALARRVGSAGLLLDLVINGFVAGVLLVFWNFARKGNRWAFLAGMCLYGLDGLWMLWIVGLSLDLGVAFHAAALYGMYRGFAAVPDLQYIQQLKTMSPLWRKPWDQ